jgi:hypothetical protein
MFCIGVFLDLRKAFDVCSHDILLAKLERMGIQGTALTVKKPFCFSFPPENYRIKDRKSRCRYQNNLPAAHSVFLNSLCQKSYGRKIPAKNHRYGRKIPAFWSLEGDFLHSHA